VFQSPFPKVRHFCLIDYNDFQQMGKPESLLLNQQLYSRHNNSHNSFFTTFKVTDCVINTTLRSHGTTTFIVYQSQPAT
jgi:hypothetical protein